MGQESLFANGEVEGTGAIINIEVGFAPRRVKLMNIDGICMLEWTDDMPDDSGMKIITAGTMSKIVADGITPYAGVVATTGVGFSIGADADINVAAETLEWMAWK